MASFNLYDDIRELAGRHFAFLRDYGFGDFEERQIAYEYHFEASNAVVTIDIWFEFTYETPVWVTVGGYHVELLAPDLPLFADYMQQLETCYAASEGPSNVCQTVAQSERYVSVGYAVHDRYLAGVSQLVQEHAAVLTGDLRVPAANALLAQQQQQQAQARERQEKGLYVCSFELNDVAEGEVEEPSLEALRERLKAMGIAAVQIIEVLDPSGKPVPFELDGP